MQIHELNTFSGTPGNMDYIAIDNGFDTAKMSAKSFLSRNVNLPTDEYNQPDFGEAGQLLRTKGDGSTEWVNAGLPTDAQTAAAIAAWLNDHPEATTTVLDGSITETKINSTFLKDIKNPFATPEMFGAAGDGVTDDTLAIQQAFDSGKNIVLLENEYYTTSPVIFTGTNRSIIGNGRIKYSGGANALTINGHDLYISINIRAMSGNGIRIDSTIDSWCQYIKFYDMFIDVFDKCVECVRDSDNWVNEIVFDFVRFNGKYGFYFAGNYDNGGYRFINCGDEICTESFIYANNMYDFNIINCRTAEVPSTANLVEITDVADTYSIDSARINIDGIKITRNSRSLGVINGGIVNSGGERLGTVATVTSGIAVIDDYSGKVSLTENSDTYDYTSDSSDILPTCFTLAYVDGGHSFTINLPFFFYTFPRIFINAGSGLHTLKLKIEGTLVETFSFNGMGYYELVKFGALNGAYMLNKITN